MTLQRFNLRECVLQRSGAIAFACVGGVECLLLGCDGCLHAQAIVVFGEPGVEGHRGQQHSKQDSGDF